VGGWHFPGGGGRGFGNTQAAQKVIAIANSVDVFMAHSVNQTIAKLEGNSFGHCSKEWVIPYYSKNI